LKKHNKKKLVQPENPPPSSPGAQPLPDAAVRTPETASPKAAVPSQSAVSSVRADPSPPAGAISLSDPTDKVPSPPHSVGNWRDHISFWFGIVGTVVGIISFVLAVYFYQESKVKPQLTFGVHPLKTELQRPDYDKELGFIYKGKPVDSESITSVQVSIWNAGTRSIRDSDVLDPFRLAMPDGSAILSVRVKKTSRPICGFDRLENQDDYKVGTCRLKWLILEPGDGAVLQIIYAGSARRDPTLEGAVEGQKDGVAVEEYSLTLDRTSILRSRISITRVGWTLILIVVAILLIFIATRIHARTEAAKKLAEEKAEAEKHLAELRKRTVAPPPVFWVLMAGAFVCLLVGLALLFFLGSPPGPPFGW
jgi:hypothetical protein